MKDKCGLCDGSGHTILIGYRCDGAPKLFYGGPCGNCRGTGFEDAEPPFDWLRRAGQEASIEGLTQYFAARPEPMIQYECMNLAWGRILAGGRPYQIP